MSFCDKCNVEVEASLKYCPLCGRCVDENATNIATNFPEDHGWKKKRLLTVKVLTVIMIFAELAAILLDILFTKKAFFSLHILFPSLLLYFSVLLPIKQKWSLSNQNNVFLLLVVLYLIWLDSFVSIQGWALPYVVPLTLLASSVYNFFVILLRKYNRFEHFMILITAATISLGIFITNFVKGFVVWPIIAAFSTSVTLLIFVILLKKKNVKNELAKKFNL